MRAQPPPRIKDVAARARVSAATVSRVLNGSSVRAPLRARVLEAVDALGYVPHGPARALASRRSDTLGAIVPTVDNAIFARCIKGLQDRLFDSGLALLLASTDYSCRRELRETQALLAHGIDGLVLVGRAHEEAVYELLAAKGVPFVFTWSVDGSEDYPCIGFDNAHAAAELTRFLLELGHRRIAMIAGVTEGNDRAEARVRGVRAALAADGLALPPAWLVEAPYSVAHGRAAAARMLAARPRPSVIVCGNDVLALGALFECKSRGIDVPGEVSIAGFDNLELAEHMEPAITTVDIPATEMGRLAAEHLMARLAGEPAPSVTVLETRLMVRATTAPPAER